MDEFCGYVGGLIETMEACADAGCRLCADELDELDAEVAG
jgi:hypothetical protein